MGAGSPRPRGQAPKGTCQSAKLFSKTWRPCRRRCRLQRYQPFAAPMRAPTTGRHAANAGKLPAKRARAVSSLELQDCHVEPRFWQADLVIQTAARSAVHLPHLALPISRSQSIITAWQQPVAERVGFEPTVPVKAQRFSRPSQSTTLAPLRRGFRRSKGRTGRSKAAPLTRLFGIRKRLLVQRATCTRLTACQLPPATP